MAHRVTVGDEDIGDEDLKRSRLLSYLSDLECDPSCLLAHGRTCAEVRMVRQPHAKIGPGVALFGSQKESTLQRINNEG
jgi:hypothetical protein